MRKNTRLSGVLGVYGRVVLVLVSLLITVSGDPAGALPAAAGPADDASHDLRMRSSRGETVPATPTKPDAASQARVSQTYGKLPLHFEANHGQTDQQVQFLARGRGSTLFLTAQEAVLVLQRDFSNER